MAIVKKMYEPVKKASEFQLKFERDNRERELKVIAKYNAKFQKIKQS